MLKCKQVKKYSVPKYPDKAAFVVKGYTLNKLPERWKRNNCVAIAMSAIILLSVTSCNSTKVKSAYTNTEMVQPPIFKHGYGAFASGGEAAYNACITEDEAYKIIEDEFKKKSIILDKKKLILKDIKLPSTTVRFNSKITKTFVGDLKLDGYSEKQKVGFEFVSDDDYSKWCHQYYNSTAYLYNIFSASEILHKSLQEKGLDKSIAVFYDPAEGEDSSKLLREQVKDFIAWLETNMIISN